MDLGKPATIGAAYDAALAEAGAFDALINNAGDGLFGPLEHLPEGDVRRQFETLVFGPLTLIRRALPIMRARGTGTIVNVTSLAARLPIPFMAPYSAAKSALAAFSATLALELEGSGVRIVDLQPGDIATAFNDAMRRGEKVDGYEFLAARAWKTLEVEMAAAPPPVLVAEALLRVLANPTPRVTIGGFFQAHLATLAARLAPHRSVLWGIAHFYGLNSLRRNASHAAPASATSKIASSE
jgi:NAD(P)-dependent dehydrogenase (short-subunit alcohol dehydrogenase family)